SEDSGLDDLMYSDEESGSESDDDAQSGMNMDEFADPDLRRVQFDLPDVREAFNVLLGPVDKLTVGDRVPCDTKRIIAIRSDFP
ncbi:hypothetical protein KIPB_016724, partial [Kipferlia bialata]